MLKLDLAKLAARLRRSRRPIVLANIASTQAQATDLYAIYLRVIAAWRAGLDRINAAYAKTLSELQTDSAGDIKGAIDDIAEEVRRLVLMLTPDLRQWAFRVERVHRGKWVQSVLSATQVDFQTILSADDLSDTLEAQIEWNVSLVRDVSDDARRKIANAVFTGLQQRKPADQVAKEIRAAVGLARARARRIASDQAIKLGERLNRARQQQAGLTHFKWRHSGKAHPRSWHKARDGRVFPWEGPGSIPADDQAGVPPFCFPSGQPVSFHGDILVLWRRYHRGDLTELVSGERVAVRCTPNHPVLTDAGWKPAKDIQVGDNIFETSPQSLLVPNMDIEQAQPLIGNIFGALELVFGAVATNGLGGEFHGDALIDEQIDTIDLSHQSLRDNLKAAIPQRLGDLLLEVSEILLRSRLSLGLSDTLGETGDASEASLVRRLNLLSSLLWRHFSPNELTGLAGAADLLAALEKKAGEQWATEIGPFRDRFQALAAFVGSQNFRFIELLAVACRAIDGLGRKSAPTAEMLAQALSVKADLNGDVAQEHPLLHGRYRKVEMIVSRAWQGHVFNLHNHEAWYIAGTVPVHNCGCTAQGVILPDE